MDPLPTVSTNAVFGWACAKWVFPYVASAACEILNLTHACNAVLLRRRWPRASPCVRVRTSACAPPRRKHRASRITQPNTHNF